jgi:hypothetical protein
MLICIQRELGTDVMDNMDMCMDVFMKKSTGLMGAEIEAFWIFHDDFYTYTTPMEEFKNALKNTERRREEYVEAELVRFDREVQMAAEEDQ